MKLSELVTQFETQERPAGNLLDEPTLLAQAVAATRFYAGYAVIVARDGADPVPTIDGELDISESEWALIHPLFMLYAERETALQVEASRGMGIDTFGRQVSEIAADIAQAESEMPRKSFYQPVVTV